MFWNKTDDKRGLPELPPIRSPRPMDSFGSEDTTNRQALPSFPDSPMNKGFSQSAIKESVSVEQEPESEELEDLPSKFQLPKMREMNEFPSKKMNEFNSSAKTEDVYVKIDRFHSARRALNSARDKLKEVEELMKKIRETKMREEQELSSWEDEIESVKSKVEDVTKSIFEKVE